MLRRNNNMSNEATTAAENQKKLEEQQRYFMQMQKNMMRQNYAQQIMGAFNTISAYKVLKTASQYGMIFPVDYNSKMVLSQKLYQALVLNNTSTDEDEWNVQWHEWWNEHDGNDESYDGRNEYGYGSDARYGHEHDECYAWNEFWSIK